MIKEQHWRHKIDFEVCSLSRRTHRNLRTRRTLSSQKWMITLAKQGKFKVGVVPADGQCCLLFKTIFVFI
jgi:hypothetical protein